MSRDEQLVGSTLSTTLQSYSSLNYSHHVAHYTHSTYVPYKRKFVSFVHFLQLPLPETPTSDNHKSDLFEFDVCVCMGCFVCFFFKDSIYK